MRSFAPGYYYNLKSMFDCLQIRYRVERFLFAFSRDAAPNTDESPVPYYIHASNRHRIIPPRPYGMSPIQHIAQILFLGICYLWLSVCCWFVAPSEDETLHLYLQRIRIPRSFVTRYLLPLISSVATCSHEELLQIPASDFVSYKRKLYKADHCTVSDGVWAVERRLLQGVDVRLACEVQNVQPIQGGGVRLRWRATDDPKGLQHTDVFDNIILAVSPDIIARMFTPLRDVMSQIPTAQVQTFIIQPRSAFPRLSVADATRKIDQHPRGDASSSSTTRFLSLRTHTDLDPWTVCYQSLRSGAFIVSNAQEKFEESSILTKARFTRVLRTVGSRKVVNEMFGKYDGLSSKPKWRNGDDGVWIAGAWCWDGMVLLEGCVVSAMRLAEAFDVEVPWASGGKKGMVM